MPARRVIQLAHTGRSLPAFCLLRKCFYHPTDYYTSKESEKNKYDRLLREQYVRSAIHSNPGLLHTHGIDDKRGLSLRTVLLLIAASSSITMGLYLAVQLVQHHNEADGPNTKRVFLPLWLDFNWLYRSTYTYPGGIRYFDNEYYSYLVAEMAQTTGSGNDYPSDKDLQAFLAVLQKENIKYKVLEELSLNAQVRRLFGLPLAVDTKEGSEFRIWIRSKHPTVSGIQVDVNRAKDGSTIDWRWAIKLIRVVSIINDALVLLGLKLDSLDTSNAHRKTHERSSGRIHEVPITDKKKPALVLNRDKDYDVVFEGEYLVKDMAEKSIGVLKYQGVIDFDHLMINRGVKVVSMSVCASDATYKVL